MNTQASKVIGAVLCFVLSACAHAEFKAPREFATLEEDSRYEQRATSAQGVVIAVREVDVAEGANLAFWSEAVTQRMSHGQGYALLETRDVRAKSGHAGRLLAFGRDQNGRTFDYWVALFPSNKRLTLMEMGGRRDRFEKARPGLERALASLTVR